MAASMAASMAGNINRVYKIDVEQRCVACKSHRYVLKLEWVCTYLLQVPVWLRASISVTDAQHLHLPHALAGKLKDICSSSCKCLVALYQTLGQLRTSPEQACTNTHFKQGKCATVGAAVLQRMIA